MFSVMDGFCFLWKHWNMKCLEGKSNMSNLNWHALVGEFLHTIEETKFAMWIPKIFLVMVLTF